MNKFILVSLNEDKKVLKESIDIHGLVTKSFDFKSDVSSICESMDILNENGFRVIVEGATPFIHNNGMVLTEGLKELYTKFKEKFGGSKDEFEEWYKDRMDEKNDEKNTDNTSSDNNPPSIEKKIPAIKNYIEKTFANNPDEYRKLMGELVSGYKSITGK
jgi:hypothetical protein